MYQACVFNFGNELCKKDPNPGTRKNLDTNITCIKDDYLESHVEVFFPLCCHLTVVGRGRIQKKKKAPSSKIFVLPIFECHSLLFPGITLLGREKEEREKEEREEK